MPESPIIGNKPSRSWLKQRENGISLSLYIQAGAKKCEIIGEYEECLKIKISSPPVDGAANKTLIAFLAKTFSLKKSDIIIEHGEFSKRKIVFIKTKEAERLLEKCHSGVDFP